MLILRASDYTTYPALTANKQTFLANYSVAARIPYASDADVNGHSQLAPSGAVVAVHGGIHPSWADIDRINRAGHSLLQRAIDANLQLPGNTPAEERDFYSETGACF